VPTDEGGFADAEGDEPGINRCGGTVACAGEAAGAGSADLTGSSLAEPAATGAGPAGLVADAGRSSPALARGATVGDEEGAAPGWEDGVAAAGAFAAAG